MTHDSPPPPHDEAPDSARAGAGADAGGAGAPGAPQEPEPRASRRRHRARRALAWAAFGVALFVVFLGAAVDNYLRAYDLKSGRELWRGRLPAGGQATPMTYLDDQGRQIVLIVAGGHGSVGTKPGDYVIAYTLPPK